MKTLNILALFFIYTIGLSAQDKIEELKPIPEAKSFTTSHEITSGGQSIKYNAVASKTYLKNDMGESVASIWSVAYINQQ